MRGGEGEERGGGKVRRETRRRWRTLVYVTIPCINGKCGENARAQKSSFCNCHYEAWIRQGSPIKGKPRGSFW